MFRRLGVRGKILAALAVPVLVLFLLAGALAMTSIQSASSARSTTTLLGALWEASDVVEAIQDERAASMAYLNAETTYNSTQITVPDVDFETYQAGLLVAVEEARRDVTRASESLSRAINRVDYGPLPRAVRLEAETVLDNLSRLPAVRDRIDVGNTTIDAARRDFSRVVDDLTNFIRRVSEQLDDRRLGAIVSSYASVLSVIDSYTQELAMGYEVLAGDRDRISLNSIVSLFPASDITHEQAIADVAALDLAELEVPGLGASAALPSQYTYDSFRVLITEGATRDDAAGYLDFIPVADWVSHANAELAEFDPVQDELLRAARARAAVVSGSSMRTAVLTIGISLAAIVLSVVAALAIARRIIGPLRRLTEAAGAVRDELPRLVEQVAIPGQGPDLSLTQIPVHTQDEVGRLAMAFNEVNATTVEVAQEQAALRASIAEMFVNVARRDQVLLNRQLSFIDALERAEEDPKTLADLFRLDHLATRMRRNAESLLVLAGIDTGRRLREPLPTSDVIRTASSEIEHYERVQLDLPVDPLMLGHTALPAAHMLAELLENATVFSEPGSPVHVSTGIDESHVIIAIQDQGLGMTEEELEEANTKIRTTSAGDVLGSQRLGLYVVGRIANRLGTQVELARGTGGNGTLVTVRMPLILFMDPSAIPLTPPTEHGRSEAFVRPEEAALAAHDGYVPSGALETATLGSAENPVEEVDLAELTDGSTERGLPRRRTRPHDAFASSGATPAAVPPAPPAESLAGASGTDSTDTWVPPLIQSAGTLASRRGGQEAEVEAEPDPEPTPEVTGSPQTTSGLPSRRRSRDAMDVPGPLTDASTATGPVNVEGRTAMFAGFRSRRAELAAASIQEAGAVDERRYTGSDEAERLAAAAAGIPGAAEELGFLGAAEEPGLPGAADEFGFPGAPEESGLPGAADEFEVPALEDEGEVVVPALEADSDFSVPALEPDVRAQAWPPEPVEAPQEQLAAPATPTGESWTSDHASSGQAGSGYPNGEDVATPPQPWAGAAASAASWDAPAAPQYGTPTPADVQPYGEPPYGQQPYGQQPYGEQSYGQPPFEAPQSPTPAQTDMTAESSFAAPPLAGVAPDAGAPDFSELVNGGPAAGSKGRKKRKSRRERKAEKARPSAPPVAEASTGAPGFGSTFVPHPLPPSHEPRHEAAAEQPPSEAWQQGAVAPEGWQQAGHRARRDVWDDTEQWRGNDDGWTQSGPVDAGQAPVPPPEPQWQASQPGWSDSAPGVSPEGSGGQQAEWADGGPQATYQSGSWDSGAQSGPVGEQAPQWAQSGPVSEPAPQWAQSGPVGEQAPQWAESGQVGEQAPQWAESGQVGEQAPQWAESGQVGEQAPQWAESGQVGEQGAQPTWESGPAVPSWAYDTQQTAVPGSRTLDSGQTFTPEPRFGTFDEEMTNMLAQRADIAQQALAELSELSNYRPQAVARGSGSLTRRTPTAVPASPAISGTAARSGQDANRVRSTLASFQTGTARGRQAADAAAPQTSGGESPAGGAEGSAGRGEPVTTPDTESTSRDPAW